ncbi:MAG: DUF418 domain-containing protein [Ferruginibacter sp.]|nr:DUF418 domain-containing protein [Chitinophagaceae bacterium]MBU9936725.1 DUF418 domain-containing protein [Ferruginibacter sp.]
MPALTPVQTNEREIFMDVLRGFAILGIFIANLNGLSWYNPEGKITSPYLLPGWDHKMSFLHHMLIEGKFYSIFSLLFGWGIALQIKRGIANGIDPMPTVKRRLLFMLLLGFMHLLIWNGDIVFFYALLSFILLPLRKFSNKILLITGTILILSPILLYWLKMTWPVINRPAELLIQAGINAEGVLVNIKSEEEFMNMMHHGSWWDQLKGNIGGIFFRYQYLVFVSRVPKVLGMFLIGYVLGRSDFYKNIGQHKKTVYWIIGIGLALGLPANYFLADYMSNHMGEYWQLKTKGLYQTIAYALGVVPLSLAYVGLFMLSFQRTAGKKILSVLAPVGKMAFSNYILHSLIGNFVFLGAGLDYMGQVGPVYYSLFGIAVFIVQIILSKTWLKYFNYGPVEWVWRSATYKKWQPFRKTSPGNEQL